MANTSFRPRPAAFGASSKRAATGSWGTAAGARPTPDGAALRAAAFEFSGPGSRGRGPATADCSPGPGRANPWAFGACSRAGAGETACTGWAGRASAGRLVAIAERALAAAAAAAGFSSPPRDASPVAFACAPPVSCLAGAGSMGASGVRGAASGASANWSGKTVVAGCHSANPGRHSRSVGLRWPFFTNNCISVSEIGPCCWPSRAIYQRFSVEFPVIMARPSPLACSGCAWRLFCCPAPSGSWHPVWGRDSRGRLILISDFLGRTSASVNPHDAKQLLAAGGTGPDFSDALPLPQSLVHHWTGVQPVLLIPRTGQLRGGPSAVER